MSISELYDQSDAVGLAAAVQKGEVTPRELVEEAISRIEQVNPRLNAVTIKRYDYARELAEHVVPGSSPLAGVPLLVKDLAVEWSGFPVTNSCAFYKDYVAQADWELARRAKAGGLIPLAKTNVPENGFSGSTEPTLHGPTRNPWDESRVPGGSSGGSSVAVAARIVPLADASDGGGSIRIPAAVNGVVGLKPSRGRVTMGPDLVDFWYGAAVFNCVSLSVRDTAAHLDLIGGALPGEPYALDMPASGYLDGLAARRRTLRVGTVSTLPDGTPLDADAAETVTRAAELCESLGHHVEHVEFRYDTDAAREFFCRMTAVASALGFAAGAQLVGREVTEADVEPLTWQIVQAGNAVSAVEHATDIETMRLFGRKVVSDLAGFDVVITPTMPTEPRPAGWYDMSSSDLDAYNERLAKDMVFTAPFNVSGQPAISLPLVTTPAGLPLGTQLVGRIGDEATLLALASSLEEAAPWRGRRPAVSAGRG